MRLIWNEQELDPGAGSAAVDAVRDLGATRGHRVGILAGNVPLHAQLAHAAPRRGWTLVPLDPDAPPAALAAQLAATDLVVSTRDPMPGRPWVACGPQGEAARTRPGPLGPAGRDGVAYLLHTSGTAGRPKAVEVTDAMLAAHAEASRRRLPDSAASVWCGVLGLHRVGGVAMLDRALRLGSTVMLEERFDAARVAARLGTATHVSLVPTMLRRLLQASPRAPPALRTVLLGGDRAPEPLVQGALEAGWPVWCTYGLTEACSQVATATPGERRGRPGTSGRPLDGVQVTVVEGEIVVAGPTVAGGGPLPTGDAGRIDAAGFLFVTGRLDDRIATGGVKVDPEPIEETLVQHPAVHEACVVGLPDAEWGERVVAVVELAPGQALPDLRAWCKGRLAAAQVPKEIHVADQPLRGPAGKLRRADVRRRLQATVPT